MKPRLYRLFLHYRSNQRLGLWLVLLAIALRVTRPENSRLVQEIRATELPIWLMVGALAASGVAVFLLEYHSTSLLIASLPLLIFVGFAGAVALYGRDYILLVALSYWYFSGFSMYHGNGRDSHD